MLQIHTNSLMNSGYKFDLLGTIMPTAKGAEWLLCVCLILRKEEKKMKKIYFDIHRDLLNPSGERCADEPMMNDTSK